MLEKTPETVGSCSEKLRRLGYSGIDNQVNLATHNDHNPKEGSAPPIGRGLEGRLGVSDRVSAIQLQGGGAVLAMSRMLATRKQPKRYYNKGGATPSDTTFSPQTGEVDKTSLTLDVVLESIRELCLAKQFSQAIRYATDTVSAYPDWEVCLNKAIEFYTLTTP